MADKKPLRKTRLAQGICQPQAIVILYLFEIDIAKIK